jgi:hypothetical protein
MHHECTHRITVAVEFLSLQSLYVSKAIELRADDIQNGYNDIYVFTGNNKRKTIRKLQFLLSLCLKK